MVQTDYSLWIILYDCSKSQLLFDVIKTRILEPTGRSTRNWHLFTVQSDVRFMGPTSGWGLLDNSLENTTSQLFLAFTHWWISKGLFICLGDTYDFIWNCVKQTYYVPDEYYQSADVIHSGKSSNCSIYHVIVSRVCLSL